jgi:hypothetical protein
MADGITWDDLPTELAGPGTEIRRQDYDGLAICLIRLEAGVRTDPLFAGLPGDRCQCAHWGHIMSGTMRIHGADGARDYTAGESYYWRRATTWRPSLTPSTSRSPGQRSTTASWATAGRSWPAADARSAGTRRRPDPAV